MSHPAATDTISDAEHKTADAKAPYSRIRITNETLRKLETFTGQHNISNDEAIVGLVESYERLTQYRYSAETGHLIAELRKLDADSLILATTNLHMMELVRSLQQADYQAVSQVLAMNATRV